MMIADIIAAAFKVAVDLYEEFKDGDVIESARVKEAVRVELARIGVSLESLDAEEQAELDAAVPPKLTKERHAQ